MPTQRFAGASDLAVALAVGSRNERALEELCGRYTRQLTALAFRVLRDEQLAFDVVQEVFVRLWERPERFDPDRGSLKAFLLADTHARSVDVVRSEEARRRREHRDHDERLRLVEPSVEDEVVIRDLSTRAREALDGLSGDERRALELAYFEGHSYREVARILDEPEGTVKSRIRVALAKLRTAALVVVSLL